MRNFSALFTAALLGMAGPVLAQSGDSTAPSQPQAARTGLSRAEVLADLDLWHRAGLTYWPRPPASELDPQFVPEYQAALAKYRQLRSSQTYRESVAKYQAMPRQ